MNERLDVNIFSYIVCMSFVGFLCRFIYFFVFLSTLFRTAQVCCDFSGSVRVSHGGGQNSSRF